MKHTVDTNLLIQDSHIHIMIYAIVAALESADHLPAWAARLVPRFDNRRRLWLWRARLCRRQWLMKAHLPGFAWLTILSGWGMALVYLIVLGGTLRAIAPRRTA